MAQNYAALISPELAEDKSTREKSHRLRYAVYCVENPFEKPEDNPDALEIDAYDSHSLHGLLIHRPTGLAIGSVRAILPVAERWQDSLPIQLLCSHPMLHDRSTVMRSLEGSRFCISRGMRKEICTADAYYHHFPAMRRANMPSVLPELHDIVARTRRLVPYLPVGLARLLLQIAVEREISFIFAAIDPRLLKWLDAFGICSTRLGEDVDHHGRRSPVLFEPLSIFENTHARKREIWKIVTDNGRLHDLAFKLRK